MQSKTEFGHHFRQLRKAHGLSQQKFADVAEMSYRHVNFLENSRAMPSREMVLKIATALELSLKNTNVLLRSAGFASSYRSTSLDDDSMKFAKAALTRILEHHNPFPCVVMTPIGDLVMANDAVFKLFSQFVSIDTLMASKNIYELFLTNDAIKEHLINWQQLAPKLLALVRQEVFEIDKMSDASLLLKRLETLTHLDPMISKLPEAVDLPLFTMHYNIDGIDLNFFSTYTTFGTPHDVALQELRIECFYPADDFTRDYCYQLANNT